MKTILVTGSCGLVGSAVSLFFGQRGYRVVGIDDDSRAKFFGRSASTYSRSRELSKAINYSHHVADVSDRDEVHSVVQVACADVIVHAAAQPSHDRAAAIPLDDFRTNALGTAYLLHAARQHCPEAPFIFLSTNKVYGDNPNKIEFRESDTRYTAERFSSHYGDIELHFEGI